MKRLTSSVQGFTGVFTAGVLLLGLAGCATNDQPGALQNARNMYDQAAKNEQVSRHASVALFEAEKAVNRATDAWENDEDEAVVDHYAYLAQKRVQIAEAEAQQRGAQQQIAALGTEREKLLVSLREAEAQRARSEAEAAKSELQRLEESMAKLQANTRQTDRGTVVTLGDVLFPINEAVLQPGAQRNLIPLASFLKQYPDRHVVIEGHTDAMGDPAYNEALSEKRADAVKTFLITQGVEPTRIQARGLGETYPVASNDTNSGRQQNRRVDIVIANVEDGGQNTAPASSPAEGGALGTSAPATTPPLQ